MHLKTKLFIIIVSLIIAGVLTAGCSDSKSSVNTTSPTLTTGTPSSVTNGPEFSAGDVVKNPKSASVAALLILGYDASSGKYERALIYPNADGSWGYRMNSLTEKVDRVIIEKVYTEKVDHVDPSSVPTSPPVTTIPTSGITPANTQVGSTTTQTTTTTATTGKPAIKKIIPDEGIAGTSVAVTDLRGEYFASGVTVKLSKSGNPDVIATNVKVSGGTSITCTLPIPVNATPGAWDVVVTNPDGQFASFTNIFSVHYDPSVVATSSGSTSGSGVISSVDPRNAISGTNVRLTITGTNIPTTSKKIILRKAYSADIVGTGDYMPTTSQVQVSFDIPLGSNGVWDIVIFGSDGTTVLGTLSNGLTIT